MPLRIAIFGQAPFGRDVAERLADAGHEVVGVHVPPDAGSRVDPLAALASQRDWPLFRYKGYRRKGETIAERVEEYLALGADLNVLPFTTVILPREIVDAPRHRSVCFHPSILPAYRGGNALSWQIIEGETESGISIFRPDDGVDTGPLFHQRRGVPIDPTDTMASLYFDKLYPLGVEAMVDVVAAIADGAAEATPQASEGASFQGLVTDQDARLDFAAEAASLDRRIRGCDPQPGAWAELRGERVRLFGCQLVASTESGERPGTILALGDEGATVAVRGGQLRIAKVRCEPGGKKVSASESGLSAGERLL